MSRIPNVVQIQNEERLQFSHVLIPYLKPYVKAVTLGLVLTVHLFYIHYLQYMP